MSGDKTAVLEAAVPILSVTDLPEALDYYELVLGFQVGWKWGEPPHLASVCRDRVDFNLSQSAEGNPAGSKVYFQMVGVDSYYSRITVAGAGSRCRSPTVPTECGTSGSSIRVATSFPSARRQERASEE